MDGLRYECGLNENLNLMKGSASLPALGSLRSLNPEKFVKVAVDFNTRAPKRLTDAPKWSFGKAKNLKYTDLEA